MDITPSFIGITLGLTLGVRHAFEPDHLAAVSVLNADGPSPSQGLLLGAMWGLGHSLAIGGASLLLASLSSEMPHQWAFGLEFGVAVMLALMGGRALYTGLGLTGFPALSNVQPSRTRRQALGVGLVHGLAGSGALTAFMLGTIPTTAARVLFVLLFALGSTLSMSVISGGLGWPFAWLGEKQGALRWVRVGAGLTAVVCGMGWGWSLLAEFKQL